MGPLLAPVAATTGKSLLSKAAKFLPSVIGGLFGFGGARQRNRAQIKMAREQMAFQERMRNTQYQAATKDLEAAGLNRILALGKPAPSPGGAMAQIQDEITPAVTNALNVRRMSQELRNMEAQERLTDRQAVTEKARAGLVQSQDAQTQAGTQQTIESTRNTVLERAGITSQNDIKRFESQIRKAQIPGVQTQEEFFKWLMSTDAEEAFIAAGKAGPLILQVVRAWVAVQRSTKK